MRQGDADVVCPYVSFNLGCRGVTATLEFACPCRGQAGHWRCLSH